MNEWMNEWIENRTIDIGKGWEYEDNRTKEKKAIFSWRQAVRHANSGLNEKRKKKRRKRKEENSENWEIPPHRVGHKENDSEKVYMVEEKEKNCHKQNSRVTQKLSQSKKRKYPTPRIGWKNSYAASTFTISCLKIARPTNTLPDKSPFNLTSTNKNGGITAR